MFLSSMASNIADASDTRSAFARSSTRVEDSVTFGCFPDLAERERQRGKTWEMNASSEV